LTFVGTRGGGGVERRLVDGYGLKMDAYTEVFAGPIVGVSPLRAFSSILKMVIGILQSFWLVVKYRPTALLLTGGWANVPVALASAVMRVPILVYLPDIEPGRTIQLLARFAKVIAITIPESEQYFAEKNVIHTGYPLRDGFTSATREEAIHKFRLDETRKTIVITGGSRGARTINQAIERIVPDLLSDGYQIIHVAGTLDHDRVEKQVNSLKLSQENAQNYHLYAYTEDIGLAYAIADLVVARAGASALAEIPYYGAPSILVPYPYAWRYQKTNADYVMNKGAGIRMDDETMTTDLLPKIRAILEDSSRLEMMRTAAQSMVKPNGAMNIAQELLTLGKG